MDGPWISDPVFWVFSLPALAGLGPAYPNDFKPFFLLRHLQDQGASRAPQMVDDPNRLPGLRLLVDRCGPVRRPALIPRTRSQRVSPREKVPKRNPDAMST